MLNRKLVRDLAKAWGMLLAIIAIMAVGVTVFVAMRSVHRNLTEAKQDYYRQGRMADLWVDVKKAPLAEMADVAKIPGVRDLRPRISFAATVDIEETETPINGLVLSLPDRREPVINDIVLRQGDYFTPVRRNEVIVNDVFARHHKLYPGSRLHLLLNNRREELIVVGTAISCEFTYLIGPGTFVPDSKTFGVFYVKQTYAEEVFDLEGATNQILVRLAGTTAGSSTEAATNEIARQIEMKLDSYGVLQTTALKYQSSNQFITGEIDQLRTFATIFPGVFLMVAALVLNALMLRTARQQRTVIGTLKAVGYSDGQVFVHFVKFGLLIGFVGGLLGALGGYGDTYLVTTVYSWFFQFPKLEPRIYASNVAGGVGISLLFALIGSLYGAWQMLRLKPAEAMRPEPPKRGGAILFERLPMLWNRLSSGWRMTLRGIMRNRFRTAMGLFSAAMGASLLCNGFMLVEGTMFLIDFQFFKVQRSDVDLSFEDERGIEAIEEIRRLPGVDHVEPVLNVPCTFSHGRYSRKGGVTGLPRGAYLTTPRFADSRPVNVADTGIVVTRRLAERLHLEVGDRLTMTPIKGNRRPVDFEVTAIGDSYMGTAAYVDWDLLCRTVDEEHVVTGAQLLLDGDPRNKREFYRELKQMPGIQAVQSRQDMIKNLVDTLLTNQRIMITIIVTFSGIVFFGSIVNASLISLAEQMRQVATFRALGYTPWQVGNIFLRENLLLSTLGTVCGMPGGYLLTWTMAHSYENEMLQLPIVTAWWVYFTALGLAILFTLAAHVVVQWNVLRADVVEGLKVRE